MRIKKKYLLLFLILPLLVALAFLTGFFSSQRGERPALAPMTIWIATDPHYIAPSLTDNGAAFIRLTENADGKYMVASETVLNALITQIQNDRPDLLLLPGDLSFNGARESHLALAAKLQAVRNAGIPVFVIPGNHDLNSGQAASFSGDTVTLVPGVTAEEFAEIYSDFGYGQALSRDPASLSYTAEPAEGLLLLMLDVNAAEIPGTISDATIRWVKQQLRQADRAGKQVLAVSHQTLLEHSFLSYGFVMGNAEQLLKLYEEYGVICNLSGHMHVQHSQSSENGFLEISGSALITWPNQIGVLRLDGHSAHYQAEPLATGVEEDARDFLFQTSKRQALGELKEAENAEALSAYFAECNLLYLAGRPGEADWSDPLYEQWQRVPSLLAYYLQTIRLDSWQDHTDLVFRFP